jgi:hypothetical protein
VSDDPYEYDVQKRVPDVEKAREVLGITATTSLDEILDEVIPWLRRPSPTAASRCSDRKRWPGRVTRRSASAAAYPGRTAIRTVA